MIEPQVRPMKCETSVKRLNVVLIKPSKYDEDGYVIRHILGVLPSNTLACLAALTEDVKRRNVLGDAIEIKTFLLDETVHKVDVRKIARKGKKKGVKTVVGLVGVQTNQFVRAYDLSLRLREAGLDVIIGGFHVSGMLALGKGIPRDIEQLMDSGVCIVAGEVEDHWGSILQDVVSGNLKTMYNFLGDQPDMRKQPVPLVSRKHLRRFVFSDFGTIDCGRGCPFNCGFCTIINVHGRKMRCRDPEVIGKALRENYKAGIDYYFFTDDNFARNKNWEAILDMLIGLRREEGIKIDFMIQVDVLSYKIENFVEKAKAAGCTNVFIGMESVNPRNLEAAGKTQNVVDDFANLVSAWHQAGVSTNVGYIIGFPGDTLESIKEDVDTLIHKIKVELASFFMMTPLPGSMDYLRMLEEGSYMDPDYNRYDSFRETFDHPNMKDGQWTEAYRYAWETFYSFDNMKTILKNSNDHKKYWAAIWKFFWYKGSTVVEKSHPMITGFFRIKDRRMRRSGYQIQSVTSHLRMRVPEIFRQLVGMIRIWWEIQELWLQTRPQTSFEIRMVKEWKQLRESIADRLMILEWKAPRFRSLHRVRRVVQRANIFSLKGIRSREDLNQFWLNAVRCLTNGRLYRIRPIKLIANMLRDLRISFFFLRSFTSGIERGERYTPVQKSKHGNDGKPTVIALSIPGKFASLKRAIESFLQELGIDIVSDEGEFNDLSNIELGAPGSAGETAGIVRRYLEGLKGKADFVILPFTEELDHFHENFVSGLSDVACDVREKLSRLPRIISFPVLPEGPRSFGDNLVGLGLCFTDDMARVVAASKKVSSIA